MNKHVAMFFSAMFMFTGLNVHAATQAEECQKLQDDSNLIYASKGFCFKDPEAKAKYGNDNCFTTRPKFSDKEQQRLDQIEQRKKELNCK